MHARLETGGGGVNARITNATENARRGATSIAEKRVRVAHPSYGYFRSGLGFPEDLT